MDSEYQGLLYCDKAMKKDDYMLAVKIFESFDFSDFNYSVNSVMELIEVSKCLASMDFLPIIGEGCPNNKEALELIKTYVYRWFSRINDQVFLESMNIISVHYYNNFLSKFVSSDAYKKISRGTFRQYLAFSDTTLYKILEHKSLVTYFDQEIADVLRFSNQSARILIRYFFDRERANIYLPKSLMIDEYEKIFQKYISSDNPNPNYLNLIFTAKNTKECPVSDKLKLQARRKYNSIIEKIKSPTNSIECNYDLYFDNVDITTVENSGRNIVYRFDIRWLKENLDYPTILNNFMYVFLMFDQCNRPVFLSIKSKVSVLENVLNVCGKDCFYRGDCFDLEQKLTTAEMALYYDFLCYYNVNIESVFQWFFCEYLPQEFGAKGFDFVPSSEQTTYLEKARHISSEMDGVLKQYNMFVEDGSIDRELYEMSSEHIVFSKCKSQIKDKYMYLDGTDEKQAMIYLFSNQSAFCYFVKNDKEYDTLFNLLQSEKVKIDDFEDYQIDALNWLIRNKYIRVLCDQQVVLDSEKIRVLFDYYSHDVVCLKYWKNSICHEFRNKRITSTLFSEPEQDYLNYMLNRSQFSDGYDLRNKYIHDTNSQDLEIHKHDYIVLLKIMVMIIYKINDDFCLAKQFPNNMNRQNFD